MRSCPHKPFRIDDSRSRDSMVEQFWDTLDRFMLPVLALIAADAFGGEGVLVSNASSCGERSPPRPRGRLPKPRKDPKSTASPNLQQLKKRRCYTDKKVRKYAKNIRHEIRKMRAFQFCISPSPENRSRPHIRGRKVSLNFRAPLCTCAALARGHRASVWQASA